MIKLAYIRELPNGKYRIFSQKGKTLGTYSTKEEAEKRLQQIEMFKSMNAKKSSEDILFLCEFYKQAIDEATATYSSMIRKLRKGNKDKLNNFQKVFKETFDKEFLDNNKDPAELALIAALKEIADKNEIKDDIVSKERDDFDNGAKAPGFYPQQSFAPYLDTQHQHISWASSSDNNSDVRRKIFMKILELLNELDEPKKDIPDIADVPLAGQYDNWAGIRGSGPVETGGFLQL